jgi:two-component system phosphate regulon sensor histidine kinase PhoR
MENHRERPEVKAAYAQGLGIDIRRSPTLKIDMLYVALPIKDNGRTKGVLRLALTLENVQTTLSAIRRIVFFGLFFALVFAFILGSILAAGAIIPINKMIQVSRKFSEGEFNRRIPVNSSDEIGELAATLNKMAEDMENKVREIQTQNQKLAAIFNSMIEGIIVVDESSRIISVNPAVMEIFGISEGCAEGKLFLEAIRNNEIFEIIDRALKKGETARGEIALIYPVRRIFEISSVPIFDGNAIGGCLSVIHDITEMRRLEVVRRDFVANVSHELKTPLTSIKGFVETLLDGALDDKENSRSFLKIVQDHTGRLDALIDDLLVLSSLESKEMKLEKNDVALRGLVEKIILGFKSQLDKKKIEVRNELAAGFKVSADEGRIEQVITNLIDNAIKFNKEKGSIKIYGLDQGGESKITVEDSGIGIPEKDMTRIFERFYRVDKARSRSLGGTGLGLSIVKHIIELHKGSVGAESAEGLGSKFWFTLPA